MRVVAYDPFLTPERARDLGVEKVELDTLFRRADFITLHTPLTEKTKYIINPEAFEKVKKGVRIINCARGGLIDEPALAEAIRSGLVAGAALDVFETEPANDNPLFGLPNVICTPHLGAATSEAQENVAVQVAEQMADYLLHGAITNAVNFPSISAEEAPRLAPFVKLAEQLGSMAGQLTETGLIQIRLEYAGEIGDLNTKALTAAALNGVLRPLLQDVNMVSAPVIARERGIRIEEVRRGQEGAYETYMRVTLKTERQTRSVAGTVFSNGRPRLIQMHGIDFEAELTPCMLYTENADKPGYIGAIGMLLGEAGVNIATFNLGRDSAGGKAIALMGIDETIESRVLEKIRALPNVMRASLLRF
jgi:D-3-phosphoglycerate dehydrogenase